MSRHALLFLAIVFLAGPAFAQQPAAAKLPPFELPKVFASPAPESLDDLRAFENHVKHILPTLRAATVSLQIGNAQGTGVIVNAEGLILTAAHVSGPPGERVNIILDDSIAARYIDPNAPAARRGRNGRRMVRGTTLGKDDQLDASMIKIESDRKDWPFCPVATAPAEAGQWCAALGHPGGYQPDRGIVLRLGRVITRNHWAIQTDCELLGGDSGGPLFNMKGEVIGINSRIGENTDFNLHVPASAYLTSWDRLLAGESFRSHSGAYLGVMGKKNPDGKGFLVEEVKDGYSASVAGVKVGDILLTFDGADVTDLPQLVELVGQKTPRRQVRLVLLRDGKEVSLLARLDTRVDLP